jgi:hypothetical protein
MATKLVIGADGAATEIELTPGEEAQRVIDADDAAAKQVIIDAERARVGTYTEDTSRQEFLAQLKTATAEQIETFVRNRLNADGVTSLATAQQFCKRAETGFVTLMKLMALVVRS